MLQHRRDYRQMPSEKLEGVFSCTVPPEFARSQFAAAQSAGASRETVVSLFMITLERIKGCRDNMALEGGVLDTLILVNRREAGANEEEVTLIWAVP